MIHVSVAGFAMVMEVLGLVFGVLGAFVIFFVFLQERTHKNLYRDPDGDSHCHLTPQTKTVIKSAD